MELERGGYFADLHKKRVAIDKLLPTLRATADGLTREIYIARASEVSGVSREVLERRGVADGAARHDARTRRGSPFRRRPKIPPSLSAARRSGDAPPTHRTGHRAVARSYTSARSVARGAGRRAHRAGRIARSCTSGHLSRTARGAPGGVAGGQLRARSSSDSEDALRGAAARADRRRRGGAALAGRQHHDEFAEPWCSGKWTRSRGQCASRSPAEQDELISEKRRLMDDLAALGGGSFKSFDRARQS